MTGVWRSWEGLNHETNGVPRIPDYSSKREEGDLAIESSNTGRFLGWLVSSNYDPLITTDIDYASPPNLTELTGQTVPLLGVGTVGSGAANEANQVHVTPTALDEGQTEIAWWISGENTKSLLKEVEEPTGPFGWRERFTSSTRPDEAVYSITDPDGLAKVTSRSSLNLISNNEALDADQGETLTGNYFHDLTTYSRGLLTNTATGGWRRDLSLMSEQWMEPGFPSSNLPFFTLRPGVETAAGRASANGAGSAGNLIYPWSVESDFTVNGGASNNQESGGASVSWDALVDFAQQYRKVSSIDASGRIRTPLEAVDPRDAIPRRPVLARVHWVFSYMSRGSRVADSPAAGEPAFETYRAYIVASPVVTFWNPYNVAIPGYDEFTMRFLNPVIPVKFKFKVGDEEQVDFYGIDNFAENNRINFIMSADTAEWAPGESRVYSATSLAGSGGATIDDATNAYKIELAPGYRTDGGARYALFKEYNADGTRAAGTKLVGAPEDVVTVTVEMEEETAFKIEILPQNGIDVAMMDILYSVPKATSDQYYDDLEIVNDGNVTLFDVEEGEKFPERFLVAVMQLRNLKVSSTDTKGYAHTKPNLFFSSNPYGNHELLDAYPYDWKFFTELNNTENLPFANKIDDDVSSGYVGTSFRATEGLERLVVYEIPIQPLRSLGELQHFDINYYNPLPPYTANPIGNSHASSLIAPNALWMTAEIANESNRASYDHSYVANHLLFDDWFVSSIAPEVQTGTASVNRETQDVYEDFLSGAEPLANEAYVPAAGVTAAGATGNLLSDTDAWHDIASQIEVDGMFNVNSTSVEAWTALLSHLNEAAMPYVSNRNGDISLESGSVDTHPVSRSTIAGDPSANLDPTMSQVGTHMRLSQAQVVALATQIVAQVKRRGPFLSLSEFVNRQLTDADVDLALAGAIEAALIELSEMSSSENPYVDMQSVFDNVTVLRSPEFPEAAAEGNVAYGFPGWVRQADVLRPIAPVFSARDDTFVIRAYGERKDPITGKTRASAWCEAVVQRRADYVDADADDSTVLPSDITLSSEANKRFGRRFSIVSFRWLSPDEV